MCARSMYLSCKYQATISIIKHTSLCFTHAGNFPTQYTKLQALMLASQDAAAMHKAVTAAPQALSAVVGNGNSLLPVATVPRAISGGGLSSAGNSMLPAAAVPKAISSGGPSLADAAAALIQSGARPIQAASAALLHPPPRKVPTMQPNNGLSSLLGRDVADVSIC